MAGYRLLANNYTLTEEQDRITGVKMYEKISGASDDLPELGDSWSSDYPGVTVIRRMMTLHGDLKDNELWQINYSSGTDEGMALDAVMPTAKSSRSLQVGGEFLNIGVQTGATWNEPPNNSVPNDIYTTVITGTIRVDRMFHTFEKVLTLVIDYGGRVNSEVFMGRAADQVLFSGASAEEYQTTGGITRYRANLNFEVRAIPAAKTASGNAGGWNHLWDKENGHWDTTIPRVYPSADLTTNVLEALP